MAKSRPDRWNEAVGLARQKFDAVQAKLDEMVNEVEALAQALGDLRSVQEEYEEWRDNLPENMQSGGTADKLNEVCDIDIDSYTDLDPKGFVDEHETIDDLISTCEGMDLPRGFGRD